MVCRAGCGACCIAPSIRSAVPGMPQGKAAGAACIHLSSDFLCALWGLPERPDFCIRYRASREYCGDTREEAIRILDRLEESTR